MNDGEPGTASEQRELQQVIALLVYMQMQHESAADDIIESEEPNRSMLHAAIVERESGRALEYAVTQLMKQVTGQI